MAQLSVLGTTMYLGRSGHWGLSLPKSKAAKTKVSLEAGYRPPTPTIPWWPMVSGCRAGNRARPGCVAVMP